MEPTQKQKNVKSLSFEVLRNVSIMLILVNLFVIGNIAYWVTYSLEKSERLYMGEVLTRVTVEVNLEIQRYIDACQGISKNALLIEYLNTTEDIGIYAKNDLAEQAVCQELMIIMDIFPDTLLNITLGSVASNSLMDQNGNVAGPDFSLSSRPYYDAVTQNKLTFSEVYTDYTTGKNVVSMANPIYNSQGAITGLIIFDILVENLSNILATSTFGESGTAILLDQNMNVLVSPNDVTSINNYSGDKLQQELTNPSGEIIRYSSGGVDRMGGFTTIDSVGWMLIAGVDVADFKSRANLVVGSLSILQILCFSFGIYLGGRYIYKKLTPMKLIHTYMHEISIGNLSATLDYSSEDEMGALVDDIKIMSKTLFTYINHIEKTIQDFADGKIKVNHNVEYQGDFKPIYDSMVSFEHLMTQSLSELKLAVHQVSVGANEISEGTSVLAGGQQKQAANIQALNNLISSVNVEITETAKYSAKISGYAGNITGNILENNSKMKTLATNVQSIKDHSNEVKRIIKAIEDVAFQTNILALNAAVEAARAGTSGKGFAVVADEVRNLSLKTSEAVQDTTKIITEMATFVEISTDLAHETSKDLQNIADESQEFSQNMTIISRSTNDQSNAITGIHDGIQEIANVVSRNSSISQNSAASTQELSAQAEMMLALIQKFEVKTK